ncbi:conserved hypothetical protein [Cotesia vestalis bracovirus]|nr:conserved hypothetical protein [Cotesia vestalis bracovirus]
MRPKREDEHEFYAIQFIELPFEGIDDYVCVPYTWLIMHQVTEQRAVVAYPKDEDPFDTRDRAKRKERYNDAWGFYMAAVKRGSNSYFDVEFWIATRNDYGPLVEKESEVTEIQPKLRVNKKLRSANQNHKSKSNDNFRKPLPRISIKRPTTSELKKEINEKRLKLDESTQSSSAVVNDATVDLRSSNRKQSVIIQDKQSMECSQAEESSVASNADKSTEARSKTPGTEQTEQALFSPARDIDKRTEAININDEDHSQRFKKPDHNNSMSQDNSSSNTTYVSMTAAKPSTTAEQSTQPNRSNHEEHIPDRSSFSNFQPQIENVRSLANVDDHKLLVDEDSSQKLSSSHGGLDSLKISAHLYRHMNEGRRLISSQKTVEKELGPTKMERNLAIATQNPSNSIDQTRHLSTSSVEQPPVVIQNQSQNDPQVSRTHTGNSRDQTALPRSIGMTSQEIHGPKINFETSNDLASVDPRNVLQSVNNAAAASQQLSSLYHKLSSRIRPSDEQQNSIVHEEYYTHSYQNQYLPTNPDNFRQEQLRGFKESNTYDHRSTSQTINMRIPSMKQNSTHLANPTYQTPELAQQRQMQPNQLDSQQQPQRPKLRIGISIKPKDRKQMPTCQGEQLVDQSTRTNSRKRVHFIDDAAKSPVTGRHLKVMSNACQKNECMVDETLSPYHAVTSDSDTVTDQEEISDHEMSTDESPVKTTNNVHNTTNDSNCGSAVEPTVSQNSTARSHQMNRKVVLEQQMLDNFASLFTQMGSTLRHTTDMYNTLRSSILETAETYKKLLGAVEQFNTAGHAATIASPSSKLRPESPRSPEARHTKVTASASSSNQDQHTNDGADKTPENKHNKLYRFVLPPEYDAYDTRWTLKYQTNLPGLVELMPQSGVYVSKGDLLYCQQVSKDCKSLAQRLLPQVFSRNALSICLSMSEKAQAANNVGSSIRPDLDDHACSVLLNFVIEHGLQRGWNTDLEPILSILHSKMEEIRSKHGVMVEC